MKADFKAREKDMVTAMEQCEVKTQGYKCRSTKTKSKKVKQPVKYFYKSATTHFFFIEYLYANMVEGYN